MPTLDDEEPRDSLEHRYAGRSLFMPWWPTTSEGTTGQDFLLRTKMVNEDGEGLLVDPGAHDDLQGSEWCERMTEEQRRAGLATPRREPLLNELNVEGVGNGAQQAKERVVHRLSMVDTSGQMNLQLH